MRETYILIGCIVIWIIIGTRLYCKERKNKIFMNEALIAMNEKAMEREYMFIMYFIFIITWPLMWRLLYDLEEDEASKWTVYKKRKVF